MFKQSGGMLRWSNARIGKFPGGPLAILALGVALGLLGFGGFTASIVYTSTEAFCAATCHEMSSTVAKEYKGSIHDTNRTGVRATCPDCHLPKNVIPLYFRKMGALHDLWGHLTGSIDSKEKFEAKRSELATRVWTYMKLNDSRECRGCHTAAKMDASRQTEKTQGRHARAEREKLTCIDCHFAISHAEPAGPGPQELKADQDWSWYRFF